MPHPIAILESPAFTNRLRQLCLTSDLAWLAALLAGITNDTDGGIPSAPRGQIFGLPWASPARTCIYLWSWDALAGRGGEIIGRLFALGMVAGMLELLVDWALIHWIANGRLVYLTGSDVMLLGSPIWMPLAWACVITELGYPGLRLLQALTPRMGLTRRRRWWPRC